MPYLPRHGVAAARNPGLRFDRILTSPLAPEGTTLRVFDGIRRSRVKSMLLIGHGPGLSRLARELMCHPGGGVSLELKMAGLCMIESGGEALPGAGRPAFLVPPKTRRLLP